MHRYLGIEPKDEVARIRAREPECCILADSVATFAGELIGRVRVPRGNTRLLLAAVLFRRIAGAFEATLLLAERGMYTEGMASRRALLEALFVLGAIHNQPRLVDTYIAMDVHRRRDIYKNIEKLGPKTRSTLASKITPEAVDATAHTLEAEAKGQRYLGPSEYAQAAKLYDIYLTDYSLLSEAAHHAAKDLERNIAVDSDGEVDGIYWGPERDPPSVLLLPAMAQTLIASAATERMFNLKSPPIFKELRKQVQRMFDTGNDAT